MQIKRLVIENFKSIERIELIEPNPFTVFVGPNGSGKSNIFEALEFVNSLEAINIANAVRLFGGASRIANRNIGKEKDFVYGVGSDKYQGIAYHEMRLSYWKDPLVPDFKVWRDEENLDVRWHPNNIRFSSFSRLFVNSAKAIKLNFQDDSLLNFSANNLEPVLKRVLSSTLLREEIFEWLDLFVPGFKAVEVDDRDELHWFEEGSDRYFTKDIISDGTYSILALLTAIYQSDEPQFLCIEEPENGLHPQVQMTLVEFFRKVCQEKGHYIWLNTHSEAIVRKLTTDEIVLVDKVDGITKTKQTKGRNIYDLPTDEAWLTGMLGGGLPW
ncbi:MAG: chromosome segregation protein SMC [Proteobacteria bacterium]|nr:MAG: chromosome segregation protein SMC [Pseudomonadota bacterium]